jgi:subtilisin family serine protease
VVRGNPRDHGSKLIEETQEVLDGFEERRNTSPAAINPKLIFRLRLDPKGNLDEEQLRTTGLRVLARAPDGAIVVFPDGDSLDELRRRLEEYAGVRQGHQYAYLGAIQSVESLTPADRTGVRLSARPLADDEIALLDIEVWHTGNLADCVQRIGEVTALLTSRNLGVTDWFTGTSVCLMRARVDQDALHSLLSIDYIKEVDRRPAPTFEMRDVVQLDLTQLDVDDHVPEGLTGVVVIDSGVTQAHPLLKAVLGDAQVFPDALRQRVTGGADDGDETHGGHGTAVAGIAVYGDVGGCIAARSFTPTAQLFSARVTDDANQYDEVELIEHQLEEAVSYFVTNYPSAKVFNISLGDSRVVYDDGRYQFRLAAVVDELAYRYRDREIVFVISSGNFDPDGLTHEEVLAEYPSYLLDSPNARVIDPATAALALTVGGLSYGSGQHLPNAIGVDGIERLVAGERGWPAPFTRVGPGVDGAIKPDLVHFAGDTRFERHERMGAAVAAHAGVPSTAKDFAPPGGRLFRTVAGTSFAAPQVANLAARLFHDMPGATSNLIKALIIGSARVPSARPPALQSQKPWDSDVLRLYGNGQPDYSRARWSDTNEVLLLTEGVIALDSFQLYTLPSLAAEFLTANGTFSISISLAYDPPTRHTRMDSYLGVGMEFALFRNVSPDAVAAALRVWNEEERENLEESGLPSLGTLRAAGAPPVGVDLKPGVRARGKGTLQKGTVEISRANWKYDGNSLVLAVICRRRWAPSELDEQRFALVASLHHDNPEVDVYAHVREQVRVREDVRVRA